jgi:hypothetical protein
MANTWEQLLTCRGPHDDHDGVQLALSCALGGTYALVCMNPRIRKMNHIARGLGSVWARESGLYRQQSCNGCGVPPVTASPEQKIAAWQKWAAGETRQRALLWQYVLDSLSSQFHRHPCLIQHETNSLLLPPASLAFEAATPDDWIKEMSTCGGGYRLTVRAYVKSLFRTDIDTISQSISDLGIRVVLECLQSLILREADAAEDTIGIVSKGDICLALFNLKEYNLTRLQPAVELLLRWHSVCLSMSADVRQLCARIGPTHLIADLYSQSQSDTEECSELDLSNWSQTDDARRALLHALEIRELAQSLSLGETQSIQVPFTMFSAATVVAAFLAADCRSLHVPAKPDWTALYEVPTTVMCPSISSVHSGETTDFLAGRSLPTDGPTALRKLSSEISMLHSQIQAVSSTWGITQSMQNITNEWTKCSWNGR